MLNCVAFMGRFTNNPELKKTTNGTPVVTFSLANARDFGKNEVDYVDFVAWKGTAETICKYCRKGSLIAVKGSIQTRSYEDKNGNKRKAVEVVVDNFTFCDKKDDTKEENKLKERFDEVPDYDDGMPF